MRIRTKTQCRKMMEYKSKRLLEHRFVVSTSLLICLLFINIGFARFQDNEEILNPTQQMMLQYLDSSIKGNKTGISVFMNIDGENILDYNQGFANLTWQINSDSNTKYKIGFLSKPFVAMAILSLQQQEKLDLDTRISKIIPKIPKHWRKITIRHLLTHTSGISDFIKWKSWEQLKRKHIDIDDMIKNLAVKRLDFKPGEKTSYSNSGYLILARIIEYQSGLSYAAFLKQSIFRPLGMQQTKVENNQDVILNLAQGYKSEESGRISMPGLLDNSVLFGTGDIVSTAKDLVIGMQLFQAEAILPQSIIDQSQQVFNPDKPDPPYWGYGWLIASIQGAKSIEHSSKIGGFSGYFVHLPNKNITMAILCNDESMDMEALGIQLIAIALEKPFTVPEPFYEVEKMADYLGIYDDNKLEQMVFLDQNQLCLGMSKTIFANLIPLEKDLFYFKDAVNIRFLRNKNEKINGLIYETRYGPMGKSKKTD